MIVRVVVEVDGVRKEVEASMSKYIQAHVISMASELVEKILSKPVKKRKRKK